VVLDSPPRPNWPTLLPPKLYALPLLITK